MGYNVEIDSSKRKLKKSLNYADKNNINNVLSTIVSRCKMIKFNSSNSQKKIDIKLEQLAIDFIYGLEIKGVDMILSVKDDWFNVVSSKERDNMILVFDKMIDIYYDVMSVVLKKDNIKCVLWKDKILEISLNNSDIFLSFKNLNANLSLFFSSMQKSVLTKNS